jgi:hypothetical protein
MKKFIKRMKGSEYTKFLKFIKKTVDDERFNVVGIGGIEFYYEGRKVISLYSENRHHGEEDIVLNTDTSDKKRDISPEERVRFAKEILEELFEKFEDQK